MARTSVLDPALAKLLRRIAKNIVLARTDRAWSQEEASERGGFDLRWYQRLESGRHSFTLETLVRIAVLFHVDPENLLQKP